MKIENVWWSTDAQVSALAKSYERASRKSKLLGRFEFAPDTTHLRGVITPWSRIPTAFVAVGTMNISGQEITFVSERYRVFGWRLISARTDLSFEILNSDVVAVEPAEFSSPVAQHFNLPFTRIRTNQATPLDNFLVCAGGWFSMPRIREKSHELRSKLQDVTSKV